MQAWIGVIVWLHNNRKQIEFYTILRAMMILIKMMKDMKKTKARNTTQIGENQSMTELPVVLQKQ